MYKFLPHTADVKIRAIGKSFEQAYSESAMALKEIILDHEKIEIKPQIKKKVKLVGNDSENLLYKFLEEFLYLLDAEDFILSKISNIKLLENNELEAEIIGDKASNYEISNKVKAITYNEMFVGKKGKEFICEFVLDV